MTNSYHKKALPCGRVYRSSSSGFGLVEVLLVILFVSIAAVSLMKYQQYLSYITDNAKQQSDASILASKQMENLRDFQVLTTTAGYTAYANIASGSSSATVGNTAYAIAWTVTTNASPAYKTINVTVSWTNRFNNAQSIQLSSQVAGVDPALGAGIE